MTKRWLLNGMPKGSDFPSPLCDHLRMTPEKQVCFWKRQETKHGNTIRLAKGRNFKRPSVSKENK